MTATVVVGASAAMEFFVRDEPVPALRRRLLTEAAAAPELIDLESASVLRRMVQRAQISAGDAREALDDMRESPIARVPHRPLLARAWELRDRVSAYDAAYVALAEHLRVPLLTCDARLGRAHGHDAEVVVLPRA